MAQCKLTYFNGRGRAEVARLLFALAGKEYEDNRVTGESWQEFKPKTPVGQLPCLELDGQIYCQSHAIERYIASENGLYGDTAKDRLLTDMLVDCLEDMFKPLVAIFSKPEEEKEDLKKKYAEETVQPRLQMFEKRVNDHGYMVSNKLMWLDVAVFSMLENLEGFKVSIQDYVDKNLPKLKKLQEEVANQPGVKAWLSKRPDSTF